MFLFQLTFNFFRNKHSHVLTYITLFDIYKSMEFTALYFASTSCLSYLLNIHTYIYLFEKPAACKLQRKLYQKMKQISGVGGGKNKKKPAFSKYILKLFYIFLYYFSYFSPTQTPMSWKKAVNLVKLELFTYLQGLGYSTTYQSTENHLFR